MASLFIGHAAQKSKLHNLQYNEGANHMAETETETNLSCNPPCVLVPVFLIHIKYGLNLFHSGDNSITFKALPTSITGFMKIPRCDIVIQCIKDKHVS